VPASGQPAQLRRGCRPIGRLVKPLVAGDENLIGTDDDIGRMPGGDRARLGFGQSRGAGECIAAVSAKFAQASFGE